MGIWDGGADSGWWLYFTLNIFYGRKSSRALQSTCCFNPLVWGSHVFGVAVVGHDAKKP
jgi:hypothetical protein